MVQSNQPCPTFSVIIPTFNAAATLHTPLNSLVAQTFRDFEVIIVDDCSNDIEALERLLRSPPYAGLAIRLHRSSEKLFGPGARNRGFELARGIYVALLDADDSWRADKLALCLTHLRGLEAIGDRWVQHSQSLISRHGQVIKTMPLERMRPDESVAEYLFGPRGWIQTSTIVLPTVDARTIQFDAALKRHSDYDFCIRAAAMGYRFHLLEQPLVTYNLDPIATGEEKGETLDYVCWWLEQMRPFLSDRDRYTYNAFELSRRLYFAGSKARATRTLAANFFRTSARNQREFLRLIGGKVSLQVRGRGRANATEREQATPQA